MLVVGAGPSGAAAAYWLATAGLDVLVVDKKRFPRDKTCGDGLTPRSVRQLHDMGLGDELAGFHRFVGLRAHAFARELALAWPRRRGLPDHGLVVTRRDLDALVAGHAEKAGATLWQGAEAVAPLGAGAGRGGPAEGAVVVERERGTTTEVRARFVVVADGANSRFGRALGTQRDRSLPLGLALRGYYASPRSAEPYLESHLDVRDEAGNVVPGYGWIFPLGDGRVNVGVGLLSTFDRWRSVNTSRLFDAFVAFAPTSWCLSSETRLGPPTGGRLPTGLSVGPRVGPDWLLVGDAGGAINPFNGEGIAYAYETGRLAATTISEAAAGGGQGALAAYAARLEEEYGLYYKVASACMRAMGRPDLMRRLVATGMHSASVMGWVLRIMSNMLRDDETGPAELAYRALVRLATRRDRSAAATALAEAAAASSVRASSASPWASEQKSTS